MASAIARWARTAQSYADPRQVGYVIFYVTNRCNFRCRFCFYGAEIEKGLKPDEMTVEDVRRLAPTIGPLLQLSLTGGEPFLRKEFAEITGVLLDATEARYVTIPTNASLTDRTVQFLEEILPRFPDTNFRICFSIEGIGEAHDELRSMPGSYRKIQESYEAVSPMRRRFPNLVLDSNSVFTAQSETTLLETVRHLSEAFAFDNISVTYARGDIPDPTLKTQSERRYVEVNEFLESLQRRKENRLLSPVFRATRDVSRHALIRTVFHDEFVTPCVAGRKLVVISETGEVFPCEILGKSMGNLRDHGFDLRALLKRRENDELRNWIVESKCKCSFECALAANMVWNPSMYPRLAVSAVRNLASG
jgi:radical SAM protein with 4Fe4S-binding SPASM domain